MELRYFVIGSWIHRWPRFLEVTTDIIYILLHNLHCTSFFLKQHKITITFKKIHLSKLLAYYILK